MPDYRFTLTREWTYGEGTLCWVMLNPSTADDALDDHTIRCVRRISQDAGYQKLVVVNLFAARATQPSELVEMLARGEDVLGYANGPIIGACIESSDAVAFAWGSSCPAPLHDLASVMVQFAVSASGMVGGALCLGFTKDGHPRHPSRIPVAQRLVPFAADA